MQLLDEVFHDVQDNQRQGKCYQPKLKADNTYQDLDCSGYHENPHSIFIVLFCIVAKKFNNRCF